MEVSERPSISHHRRVSSYNRDQQAKKEKEKAKEKEKEKKEKLNAPLLDHTNHGGGVLGFEEPRGNLQGGQRHGTVVCCP